MDTVVEVVINKADLIHHRFADEIDRVVDVEAQA